MASDLNDAISLAVDCHRGQVDKAGQPYILHVLRVMLGVEGERERIAAALHDAVEDTWLSLQAIRDLFGEDIALAVDALTRRADEGYSDFIQRCKGNTIASAVKLSDLRDNMDLSRLQLIDDAARARLAKYQGAYVTLKAPSHD